MEVMARAFLETQRKLILVCCNLELDLKAAKIHPVYQMTSISVANSDPHGFFRVKHTPASACNKIR